MHYSKSVRLVALVAVSSLQLSLATAAFADVQMKDVEVAAKLVATSTASKTSDSGQFGFKVFIVDDLVAKPVPLSNFQIYAIASAPPSVSFVAFRTDESGAFSSELAAGKYRVQSATPLLFKSRLYSWSREFEIKKGEISALQLTGDDAIVTEQAIPLTRQIGDEAKIYRALRDGVATVESERGQGTGFLVDSQGLILTNHHVVEGSRSIVVRFLPGLRVAARLVFSNAANDVALLQVSPDAVRGLPIIPLADVTKAAPIEGERVLAIGSPLSEEKILTTGLLSRVKDDVFMSDVNINPGNSGGPLLNMAGEAIGITSFSLSAANGPGLSGIVSIIKATAMVSTARAELAKKKATTAMPSPQLLPDFSTVKISTASLQEAAQSEIKIPVLKAPSSFETSFFTPFSGASLAHKAEREWAKKRNKRRDKQSANGSDEGGQVTTQRFYDTRDAQVFIAVAPRLMESKSSRTRGLFGALLGVYNTKRDMEFRHDFYDMELLRDGERVEPLRRRRLPLSIYYENLFLNLEAKDTAMAGLYSYDPAVFRDGGKLELHVKREFDTEKWDIVPITDALRAALYTQFSSYYSQMPS